jgi:ribosomal protein L37AE/L43A
MPPVDRNAPCRADSSESTYSLMEFMREFPDDAACLEHLWRSSYAPDGEHTECPKCKQERVFRKYATAQGRQSWTCTGCGCPGPGSPDTLVNKLIMPRVPD